MTDLTKSEQVGILKNNYIGNLGYIAHQNPFVIPITYFFDEESNSIISYSAEGHKIDSMRKNKQVSFAIQEIESINNWKSLLIHGTFEELKGLDAKQKLHTFSEGVKGILLRKEYKEAEFISEFSSKLYSRGIPTVFRIAINEITGKRKET